MTANTGDLHAERTDFGAPSAVATRVTMLSSTPQGREERSTPADRLAALKADLATETSTKTDAHPDVIRAARRVLTTTGGRGAVREICDMLNAARSSQMNPRP